MVSCMFLWGLAYTLSGVDPSYVGLPRFKGTILVF